MRRTPTDNLNHYKPPSLRPEALLRGYKPLSDCAGFLLRDNKRSSERNLCLLHDYKRQSECLEYQHTDNKRAAERSAALLCPICLYTFNISVIHHRRRLGKVFLRRPCHILQKEVRRRPQALAQHRRRCHRPTSRRNQHLVVRLESLQPVVRSASRRVTLATVGTQEWPSRDGGKQKC